MVSAASQRIAYAESPPSPGLIARVRHVAAYVALARCMMATVEHAPWLLSILRPAVLPLTWWVSPTLRRNLTINARRLLGDRATPALCRRVGKAVLANFYESLVAMGRTGRQSAEQWREEVVAIEGDDRYRALRADRRGAILVTAHLGAFEHGAIALRDVEPRVHIVFRRDPMPRFERLRAAQRARFGVTEAPVDEGLAIWFALRDALQRDEVVLMQGDRVMPGQPGTIVPFLSGHIRLPLGPVKLAQAAGAPIVPTFSLRQPDGRVRIVLEEPIEVNADEPSANGVPAALRQLAAVIERYVRDHPEQWLMVQPALVEDAPPQTSNAPQGSAAVPPGPERAA